MGYPKKACPSWFQIRERERTGATILPKPKKAWRLQVSAVSLDTWVPMSLALSIPMSMLMSKPCGDKRLTEDGVNSWAFLSPLPCSCLPGEIYRKGVGVALVQFLKKATEYKCMELGRGVYAADGKN